MEGTYRPPPVSLLAGVPGRLVGDPAPATKETPASALPLHPALLPSVAVCPGAAALFADRLDHVGPSSGLSEPLVGLLTALAADGPEIASALIALSPPARRA